MVGHGNCRPLAELADPVLGFVEQPSGLLVGDHELLESKAAVGETAQVALGAVEHRIDGPRLAILTQLGDTAEAIFPSTPFTKRPASSPLNVFASSIDSLMAARGGTLRAMVSS